MPASAACASASIFGSHCTSVGGRAVARDSSVKRHLAPSAFGISPLPSTSSMALSAVSPGRSLEPVTS